MKKILTALLVSVLLFSFMAGTALAANENLLKNGNLAVSSDKKVPEAWQTSLFADIGDVTWNAAKGGAPAYVTISSTNDTDARIFQEVPVESNTLYLFTAEAKASDFRTQDQAGANISVLGKTEKSASLYDTDNQWKKLSLIIKADNNVESPIKVTAGIGGHSSMNAGNASFRNLKIVKIDKVTPGIPLVTITAPQQNNGGPSAASGKGLGTMGWLVIIFILLIVGGVIYYIFASKPKGANYKEDKPYVADPEESQSVDEDVDEEEETKKEDKYDDLL